VATRTRESVLGLVLERYGNARKTVLPRGELLASAMLEAVMNSSVNWTVSAYSIRCSG